MHRVYSFACSCLDWTSFSALYSLYMSLFLFLFAFLLLLVCLFLSLSVLSHEPISVAVFMQCLSQADGLKNARLLPRCCYCCSCSCRWRTIAIPRMIRIGVKVYAIAGGDKMSWGQSVGSPVINLCDVSIYLVLIPYIQCLESPFSSSPIGIARKR